ncbi:uncharacterized protein LOC108624386 [Ceratina calcarata]|uniref:Uncharacterized protein LOC108624386 n=1 Tax=Ceratina calcarata TaxID=156304 RepID=A0AAJ7IXT3_9HYME|nr:uncharacterized protein LOC108624386 [Ceratina calcarata]
MDVKILEIILNSCETVTKDFESSKDYRRLLQKDQFLPTSEDLFNALCLSLTKLLSYKVSKEASQYYTARLSVIGLLRDWCRIKDTLEKFKILRDEKQALKLRNNLLENYLTDDVLDICDSVSDLASLTSALICLTNTNSYYKCYLEKLLLKLAKLESCDESEYLLCYAVQKGSDLSLQFSIIENIYESQRCKFIEQPLLSDFMSQCTNLAEDNDDNSENVSLTNQLFVFASKSPHIFVLICGFLKELLVQLDYASTVMKFIQSVLERIKGHCESSGGDILDLYPRNLQSLIILLRIEPSYHTNHTEGSMLRRLKAIYDEDKDTVIMLLSHYPQWLKLTGEYLRLTDIE